MPVTVDVDDAVATVTVDNPPVNSLDDPTLEALGEAARRLSGDAAVRVIVLTGAGERRSSPGRTCARFSMRSARLRWRRTWPSPAPCSTLGARSSSRSWRRFRRVPSAAASSSCSSAT